VKYWLLAIVLVTHYGYYLCATPTQAEAVFYVLRGIEGALLFAIIGASSKSMIMSAACWLGVFEESQTAVCGMTGYGIEVPLASGLCIEQYGYWPYAVVAASAITYLWAHRDDRPNR